MAWHRKIVAVAAASLLIAESSSGKMAPLGVVLHAERAHVGQAETSVGSTLFEGDRLSTDANGVLRAAICGVTLQLGAQSSVVLGHAAGSDGDIFAELASGILVFSTVPSTGLVVAASDALVHPAAKTVTVAHVRVVSRKELRIYAQRGGLEFSYRGERQIIPEGKTYQVLLDPSEKEVAASRSNQAAKSPANHRVTFIFVTIALGGAAEIAIPILARDLESPDEPGRKRRGKKP